MPEYTGDFALVCEGITDYSVVKNILLGYFKGQNREPIIQQRQPDCDATNENEWQKHGNWENVFRFLREKKHQHALQYNEYLIVQVDTDDSEHVNFGVSQRENGQPLSTEMLIQRVWEKLRHIISPADVEKYGDRIIFAICVQNLECWLLPLWETDNKAAKTSGCLGTLNAALARKNLKTINPEEKKQPAYDNASCGYRKRAALLSEGIKNPSLKVFLDELERRAIVLSIKT